MMNLEPNVILNEILKHGINNMEYQHFLNNKISNISVTSMTIWNKKIFEKIKGDLWQQTYIRQLSNVLDLGIK